MIKIKETQDDLERYPEKDTTLSQRRTIETSAGPLVLQTNCSPLLVKSLSVDRGLHAFMRIPEREHALFLSIAQRPDSLLTLAYTPDGEIVGQVTLAPCDMWGPSLSNTYEIAIEVSTPWRRLGLARQLLSCALEMVALEELTLLAIGLAWHWDTQGVGLSAFDYRRLIMRLFSPYGFKEYPTTEPNICMDLANILLVRIGSRVGLQAVGQLMNHLLDGPLL